MSMEIGRVTGQTPETFQSRSAANPRHRQNLYDTPHLGMPETQSSMATGAPNRKLAMALGIASIGLGLAEALAPRQTARLIGVEEKNGLLRSLGAREIANGMAILREPQNARWLQSRVAGDAMDLALLAGAMRTGGTNRGRAIAATAAVAAITALDLFACTRCNPAETV